MWNVELRIGNCEGGMWNVGIGSLYDKPGAANAGCEMMNKEL
jgi:hypothetical protein